MSKAKFVVLSLMAAALLSWQIMPASVDTANSGIVDPCSSFASGAGCYLVCPLGDGNPAPGAGIAVTVKDGAGAPIPGIPAADFWLVGCNDNVALCGGSGSINATAATDANGQTTITGAWAAGGCDDGVYVVVQGTVVGDGCAPDGCVSAILVRSPDINGDLDVNLLDFSLFGTCFAAGTVPPADTCCDLNCSGNVDLLDFSIFGSHWTHIC